ncbi:hypothetical protein G6F57_021538 [Rhizopus arrhizus]|nr:hypothetical protein G6F57_021538 [Rhizopus arrhizus]
MITTTKGTSADELTTHPLHSSWYGFITGYNASFFPWFHAFDLAAPHLGTFSSQHCIAHISCLLSPASVSLFSNHTYGRSMTVQSPGDAGWNSIIFNRDFFIQIVAGQVLINVAVQFLYRWTFAKNIIFCKGIAVALLRSNRRRWVCRGGTAASK